MHEPNADGGNSFLLIHFIDARPQFRACGWRYAAYDVQTCQLLSNRW